MTSTPFDELGPVDYVVVAFPAGAKNFTVLHFEIRDDGSGFDAQARPHWG